MPTLTIRPISAGDELPRDQELAWQIALAAAAKPPIDAEAADMAINRVIDSVAVAVPALRLDGARTGQAQAALYPRNQGAALLGVPGSNVDCAWASWANGIAVRELDFHDNVYGYGVAHPADSIPSLLAVAQQCGRDGSDLVRAIITAYEIQAALVAAIDLNSAGVDHVAHLGPAIVAGLGALLELDVETIYQAVNQAAHLSCAPLQARKGAISNWKAAAPAYVGKLAVEAVDRAMRRQTSPAPIYEGQSGLLSTLMGGQAPEITLYLPDATEARRAILESYPKAHAAAYHAQAFIDLAFRMRTRIPDLDAIEKIHIHTKGYTHRYLGSGANDPNKYDPSASRETLDHSIMYIFAVALEDGAWHYERSYGPERARQPATVRLWRKISTCEDEYWSRRFTEPRPIDKDHGGRVIISLSDGSTIEDEIDVPESHPRGVRPFARKEYKAKFSTLTDGLISEESGAAFLDVACALQTLEPERLHHLNVALSDCGTLPWDLPKGLLG